MLLFSNGKAVANLVIHFSPACQFNILYCVLSISNLTNIFQRYIFLTISCSFPKVGLPQIWLYIFHQLVNSTFYIACMITFCKAWYTHLSIIELARRIRNDYRYNTKHFVVWGYNKDEGQQKLHRYFREDFEPLPVVLHD